MTFHSFAVGSDMDAFVPGDHHGYYQTPMLDNAQPNGMHMVDPRLQSQSRPPQMERFLMESNKTLFNPPRTQAARDGAFYPSRPEFIAHLPPGSVGRHGSPFSQQYSPASSGAHSPHTESDMCHDGTQGPSTPPDVGVMSPFMAQNPYDYMDSHSSMHFPLTGLAPNDQCVNLSDINPVNNLTLDQHDRMETPIDFTVDSAFTLPSNSSSAYDSVMFMQPVLSQHAGAENVQHVKEEAGAHDCSAHTIPEYPDPEEMEEDLKIEDESMLHSAHLHDTNHTPTSRMDNAPRRSRRPSVASPKLTKPKSFKPTAQKSKTKILSVTASAVKLCSHCSLSFKDETALQKHTRTQHTRPFTCVFHYAGCPSTFATKNEWKRHVVSQHLALTYWLCKADSCAKSTGPSTQQRSASLPTHGAIFNRKDLYTQHVRRMHAPPHARKAIKNKKPAVDWDESLRLMQDGARQDRCHLPVYMRCPADGCEMEFRGATAWDDRMEHVARHLERAAAGEENPVCFGGYSDPTLTEWAEMHGVDVVRRTHRGWELSNPLRGEGGSRRISAETVCEEDAEGEDC